LSLRFFCERTEVASCHVAERHTDH
jgi:hypothetical protein